MVGKKQKAQKCRVETTKGYDRLLECLKENAEVAYEEVRLKILSRFPWSKFNEQHFRWYKWKMKKVSW